MHLDVLRRLRDRAVANWRPIAFDDLVPRRLPTRTEEAILDRLVPRAKLAHHYLAVGLVVRQSSKPGIGARRRAANNLHLPEATSERRVALRPHGTRRRRANCRDE